MGEFGDKFRTAREKKELSFDDVSNVTKISSRMLQAIEEEHFDQLPGGVFNKGFIRAYAKHLGLNGDEAVSDYLACLRQAQIDSHAGWDAEPQNGRRAAAPVADKKKTPEPPVAKPVVKPTPPPDQVEELPELQLPRAEHIRPAKKQYLGRPSSETPWRLIGVAALVVVAGIFFWVRHSRGARDTVAKASTPTVSASASTAAASVPAPTPSVPAPTASVPAANPVATPQSQPAATQPTPVAAPATSTPSPDSQQSDSEDLPVARKGSATPAPADPTQVKVQKKGDVTIRSFGATSTKPAETSAAKLTLVIRASENSWVSVTSDGQLVTQETLIAPAATSFHASRELVVRVGNAAGVSFLWNGDELPAQGSEAEAKTFVFDAQGMRAQASTQAPAQN